MVTIVAKISNDETKDFSRVGIDGRDWGRSAISINSEGNKEIVSGILFFISKSSNVEFVLFEIFRKISRKKYLLIIQKTMAVKIIIKLKAMANIFSATLLSISKNCNKCFSIFSIRFYDYGLNYLKNI